jgi:hypothetical protein
VAILVSPSQISGLFRHDDCREMVSLRIPNPDSLGSRNKEVSLLVDFDSVECTAFAREVLEKAIGILFSTRLPSDFRTVRKNNIQVSP